MIGLSDFLNEAKQWELTIYQLADMLSRHEVWGLARRYYRSGNPNDGLCSTDGKLYHPVRKPSFTKVYKTLRQLDQINEEFEYAIAIGDVNTPDYWCNLTFTIDGDFVLLESY